MFFMRPDCLVYSTYLLQNDQKVMGDIKNTGRIENLPFFSSVENPKFNKFKIPKSSTLIIDSPELTRKRVTLIQSGLSDN